MFTSFSGQFGIDFLLLFRSCFAFRHLAVTLVFAVHLVYAFLHLDICDLDIDSCCFSLSFGFLLLLPLIVVILLILRFNLILALILTRALAAVRPRARARANNSLPFAHIKLICPSYLCPCQIRNLDTLICSLPSVYSGAGAVLTLAGQGCDRRWRRGRKRSKVGCLRGLGGFGSWEVLSRALG